MQAKDSELKFPATEKGLTTWWRVVELACAGLLVFALFAVGYALLGSNLAGSNLSSVNEGLIGSESILTLAPLNSAMLALISFIALIVVRYARRNLHADQDSSRFLLWLGLTIAAVMVTVVSNHLLLFWLAWVGISLSLHQLLMFYPHRPRAALAAHKKFILARIAEVLLGGAFILLYIQYQTPYLSEILVALNSQQITASGHLVAVLLALVALIKCAQLPVHGWLIQVVEAPTPVSALLHAGVINMGGFLLLSFAPLLSQAWLAQWLLLVAAGLSTVLAALVMMTRISIKVRLAWSTSAQMGLMLVECALGLYELALLHLVAHSCYKAHAFLSAGGEVNRHLQRLLSVQNLPGKQAWMIAGLMTLGLVVSGGLIVGDPALVSPWIVLALAIVMLLAARIEHTGLAGLLRPLVLAVGVFAAYAVLKWSTNFLAPGVDSTIHWTADLWVASLFIGLFVVHLWLHYRPHGVTTKRIFIALNAGFYLDEWASKWTLKLWPARLPRTKRVITQTQEAFL